MNSTGFYRSLVGTGQICGTHINRYSGDKNYDGCKKAARRRLYLDFVSAGLEADPDATCDISTDKIVNAVCSEAVHAVRRLVIEDIAHRKTQINAVID